MNDNGVDPPLLNTMFHGIRMTVDIHHQFLQQYSYGGFLSHGGAPKLSMLFWLSIETYGDLGIYNFVNPPTGKISIGFQTRVIIPGLRTKSKFINRSSNSMFFTDGEDKHEHGN